MRAAVIQCVIPTALYGAEVFYTGRGQKGLIDSLRSLLRLAALAILPAYRTTPTSALLREADLPYPEALLDGVLQRAAVRYASLDARHPIARVTINAYDTRGTRLTRILHRVPTPAPERARVESRLPPLRILPTTDTNTAAYAPAPLRLTVYSDGSRTSQGAGYGFVVYYGSIPVTQGYGSAGSQTEVYDAEIMGAVEGLQAAVNLPCASYSTGLVILLDNLAVASLLADGRPVPHRRKLTDLFQKLTTQWKSAAYILSTPRTPVEVRWMPGHSGIAGNEIADELAKKGAALDGSHIPPSRSYLTREAK
jgi:ribonuclease HI